MQIQSQFVWNTIDRIETHHKHLIVGTTLQHVYIVCSYCAASEVPVARLPGSSGFGKACCFFSRQHGRFGKAWFLFTFVQCTVSLSAGCFFECVTGKTPVTQSNQKRRVMKKMNIINKSINRYISIYM